MPPCIKGSPDDALESCQEVLSLVSYRAPRISTCARSRKGQGCIWTGKLYLATTLVACWWDMVVNPGHSLVPQLGEIVVKRLSHTCCLFCVQKDCQKHSLLHCCELCSQKPEEITMRTNNPCELLSILRFLRDSLTLDIVALLVGLLQSLA